MTYVGLSRVRKPSDLWIVVQPGAGGRTLGNVVYPELLQAGPVRRDFLPPAWGYDDDDGGVINDDSDEHHAPYDENWGGGSSNEAL